MTTQIVELENGRTSLEFEEADLLAVKAMIVELFGKASETKHIMATDVQFGGERFTFQSEWNDPCLISSTERGGEYLRRIHTALKVTCPPKLPSL